MRIVKLPPERWRDYKALRLGALVAVPEAFGSTYESAVAKPDSFWISRLEDSAKDPLCSLLFAETSGRLVGMVGAFREGNSVKLISMFVREAERGKGIGRNLAEALIAEVRSEDKVIEIRLDVRPSQSAAIRLYERLGFARVAESEIEGRHEVTMALTVPGTAQI